MIRGFGVFSLDDGPRRVGWREHDRVLDLAAAELGPDFVAPSLDFLIARGRPAWERALEQVAALPGNCPSVPLASVQTYLPFTVADFVDFYASIEHATAMGRIFRPQADPLPPSWRRMPLGYHGRAGSVVASGTAVRRPRGQIALAGLDEPSYAASVELDVELELGFVVGAPSTAGVPVALGAAADHIFGAVIVNDWSARDIQRLEAVPLGPFLGKSFQTSISAWVTPLPLLEPARVAAPPQQPQPLPHLRDDRNWALDLELELALNGIIVSRGNARSLYWSMPQLVAHLTSNGASLRSGDLIATGTISGVTPGSEGSLIELTANGTRPLELPDGSRTFLADGDEAVMTARAAAVALAEVRGRVLPA